MDYDDAVEAGQPSLAIKQRFYSEFIEPYLTKEPQGQELSYLMDQGWHAWRVHVKKQDIKNMLFVKKMCEQLYRKMETDFTELASYLLDEINDAQIRTHNSEKNFYEAKTIEEKFTSAVRHYKVYFETEFRIWGTIPYFYACKILGLKNSGSTPETYVKISASTKYYTLKNIQTILLDGDIKELVKGFDTELRNAGDGHDSYELTDNDTILMHVLNPKTGMPVGSKSIELTYGQLDGMISLCRKSIWVLRNGFTIFLNNNPEFRKKLKSTRPLKVSEIRSSLESFARDRRMYLDNFQLSKDRKHADISLRLKGQDYIGHGGELLFGNGERYEIINIKDSVNSKYQIISVFQYLVRILRQGNTPEISAEIFNDKKESIAKLEYELKELEKFFLPNREENIPIPRVGNIPEFMIDSVYEVKVPYGLKSEAILLLKAKGHDVIG